MHPADSEASSDDLSSAVTGTPVPALYVVATPLGNLGDLSKRARAILSGVDMIACEDTRVSQRLFPNDGKGAQPAFVVCNEQTESGLVEALVARVNAGGSVALISDAGTPAISDPGFRVVRHFRKLGLPVLPVPGPCAVTTALSVSGLPSDRFLFAGFLKPKSAARRAFLENHRDLDATIILYESTHRIEKLVDDIVAILGSDRHIFVAREMTKKFETYYAGTAENVRSQLKSTSTKGEFVVLIAKAAFAL